MKKGKCEMKQSQEAVWDGRWGRGGTRPVIGTEPKKHVSKEVTGETDVLSWEESRMRES